MREPIRTIVHGAAGRMGRAVLREARASENMRIVAALVRDASPLAGSGDGDLVYSTSLARDVRADVLIDFSTAAAFDQALDLARARRIAFLSGTTGLAVDQRSALTRAAASIPVLWSANFSVGVALLAALARQAAVALRDWDCEIVEAHHRHKRDAPSGTALALGRAIADARGVDFARVARVGIEATRPARAPGEIGFAAIRGGDIVGEHTIAFIADGERIELVHRATDRDIFARGALRAAEWLAARGPGVYTIDDMLASALP